MNKNMFTGMLIENGEKNDMNNVNILCTESLKGIRILQVICGSG